MEITNEFKMAAFMAYWGSEYKYESFGDNKIYTTRIDWNTIDKLKRDILNRNAKLILTPLEIITDEQYKKLTNILNIDKFFLLDNKKDLVKWLSNSIWWDFSVFPIRMIDKLREWKYNIPFKSVDLVEAGIAVLKQKEA